jgi:peptide chain release factor 2
VWIGWLLAVACATRAHTPQNNNQHARRNTHKTTTRQQHQRPKKGFACETLERSPGEEAGIKSAELRVAGRWAYGRLRGEHGTHRLVRSSPFNARGLRQTSFAGVEVLPLLDDGGGGGDGGGGEGGGGGASALLQIPESDLEVSFMRSSGAGGQNVNKLETGVRLTHTPTGLSVRVTQERTQLANRAIALQRLRAKLLVLLEAAQAAELAELRGDAVQASWGQQIRNYVLHPYKLAKDTRTGAETADVEGVLDAGPALDALMTAFLRWRGAARSAAASGAGGGGGA